MNSVILYLVLQTIAVSVRCEITQNDNYQYYLGTKTPYRIVANLNDSTVNIEECKPKKIWMLIRHGTRNPSLKQIQEMNERLPEIRELILKGNLLNDELFIAKFKKWKPKVSDGDQKKLTHVGEDEMIELAERMQNRFPNILSSVYSNSSYKFKFTDSQRTRESAKHFAIGLFGKVTANDVWFPEPHRKDPILRFYKACNKWRKEVKKNATAVKEAEIFKNGNVANETIVEVSKKLGLAENLTFSDVELMYKACAFETAWNEKSMSPWCHPFSLKTIKVMEFYFDLKHYWVDGYGHEITYKQACPAFNNMVEFFQRTTSMPKAVFYFTHSGTILKMLAHLGLYKDNGHLLHDSFEPKKERKWNVSKIDAFGSNLAFVLHDCNGEKKILFLHQEDIKKLPSCQSSDLCSLDQIRKYYNSSISCSFNQICDIKPDVSS